ncbi:hypothetical protein M5D96_013593 [Drosophila gunungcola]|uniref:Uncharacterized protein n=1 Tax=Drosophila gunungcola TaxID=103775 RepID=A0A9P9YAY7_9MUSC|nr:hypothetical protein M5D96_013593 [Drosophila gunungcola]
MHPEPNPTDKMDGAVLDQARKSIEAMHDLAQTLMVDFKDDPEAAQLAARTINACMLELIDDLETAQTEEQQLSQELQRFQDK